MVPRNTTIRIVRPTDNLEKISSMYQIGLGLNILAQFHNHERFDGVILGHEKSPYHFAFTRNYDSPSGVAPTKDNLIVFYLPDTEVWMIACCKMHEAGFRLVKSHNPFWDNLGKTFEDLDGYRIVLQNSGWEK